MEKGLRIGCSSAFWGDSSFGAAQLVHHGQIQYLVADYLAEVTMGLLARAKQKNQTSGGFVPDFVFNVWKPLMKECLKKGIKIVTNAGGLNPEACRVAISKIAKEAGLEVKVASVSGDDLIGPFPDLLSEGHLRGFESEGEKETIPSDKMVMSANAYIGARPIVSALQKGAQVVVTGRCVDSALVLGPLIYEFGWRLDQYDLLAAGSLAGHLIECACQATGGNFTDWELSAFSPNGGWANMGFPIAQVFPDGRFLITKPEKTGGIVSTASVGEQMVYEIGDTSAYILPDVVVDLTSVTLKSDPSRPDVVWVEGTKGREPTTDYKVSVTYVDGYKMVAELLLTGVQAPEKAKAVMDAIVRRVNGIMEKKGLPPFIRVCSELIGAEQLFGENKRPLSQFREVIARLTVHHSDPRAMKIFALEIAPSATAMAPGITGGGSGRPRPTPLLTHVSGLIEKKEVAVHVAVSDEKGDSTEETIVYVGPQNLSPMKCSSPPVATQPSRFQKPEGKTVPLLALVYGRSGDKGNNANIGIICRDPTHYSHISEHLTPQVVLNYLSHLVKGRVSRYELPGISGFNFMLTQCLDGGGLSSLQIDRQGKTFAQLLLTMPIPAPPGPLPPSGVRSARL